MKNDNLINFGKYPLFNYFHLNELIITIEQEIKVKNPPNIVLILGRKLNGYFFNIER